MATTSGTAQQKTPESPSSQPTRAGGAPSTESNVARKEAMQSLQQRRPIGMFGPVVRQMSRINEEMDRLFDSLGFGSFMRMPLEAGLPALIATDIWTPNIELFQRDQQLVIRADLPGLKREDVSVEIDEDRVVLRGERRQERTQESGGAYRSEVSYGMFERVIPLPEGIDPDKAQANYHDGVLSITLPAPQSAQARGRKLDITEGPSSPQGPQTTH